MASYVLAETIEVSPDLLGTIRVDRANRYTPEDRKEALGYRPSLPLLVNSMTVDTVADIASANVAEEGHFIISPLFTEGPGNTLYDQGAKPGSIGTKTLRDVTTIYVFRTPYENEVVWYVVIADDGDITELGFHRWDGETWQPYKTWPERALEGMQAFEVLDPDRIWEYYARVVGGTLTEWMVDARAMLDFLDPDRCPIELLPELAQNFGLNLDAAEQEEVQRQKVRDAIPTYKLKGLPLAVELRLRSLGFLGYSREIWVNPDNPNNYTDDDTGEKGDDWIEVVHGSRYRIPRVGLLFVGAEQPSDGEVVVIDDYTTAVTFEFEISGGVGGGNTPVAVGADAEETLDNLITAVNASALTLEASETPLTDWPEMSLDGGKIASDSIIIKTFNYYFPGSRVSIHINQLAGQPLSMTSPASALDEFEQFIATQLGEDVLPAPIDIRFFATDLEVGPPGSRGSERLQIGDALLPIEVEEDTIDSIRANRVDDSRALENWNPNSGTAVIPDTYVGFWGEQTMDRMERTTGGPGYSNVSKSNLLSDVVLGADHIFSVDAREDEVRYIQLRAKDTLGGWHYCNFDLRDGGTSWASDCVANTSDNGDGSWHCEIKYAMWSGAVQPNLQIYIKDVDDAGIGNATLNDGDGIYMENMQLEQTSTFDLSRIESYDAHGFAIMLVTGGLTPGDYDDGRAVPVTSGIEYPIRHNGADWLNVVGDPTGETGAVNLLDLTP